MRTTRYRRGGVSRTNPCRDILAMSDSRFAVNCSFSFRKSNIPCKHEPPCPFRTVALLWKLKTTVISSSDIVVDPHKKNALPRPYYRHWYHFGSVIFVLVPNTDGSRSPVKCDSRRPSQVGLSVNFLRTIDKAGIPAEFSEINGYIAKIWCYVPVSPQPHSLTPKSMKI